MTFTIKTPVTLVEFYVDYVDGRPSEPVPYLFYGTPTKEEMMNAFKKHELFLYGSEEEVEKIIFVWRKQDILETEFTGKSLTEFTDDLLEKAARSTFEFNNIIPC